MPTMQEVRQKYPQYNDMSDDQLAGALHSKFYSDMPEDEFRSKIGLAPVAPQSKGTVRGMVLPFEKNLDTGQTSLAMPSLIQGMIDSGAQAITAPGRAMSGELPMTGMDGMTSPQAIGEGFNLATWMTPGGAAVKEGAAAVAARKVAQEGNQARLAAARLGVDVPKHVTSDSAIVQSMGEGLRNQPIVGSPLIKATEKAKDQVSNAVRDVQAQYGKGSVADAGSLAREGITGYSKKTLGEAVKAKYDAVDGLVAQNVLTPASKTAEVALDISSRRANATIPGKSGAVDIVKGALDAPGGLNYKGIKDLRSHIGEMLDEPSLIPAGTSQTELKRIYGALSEDLKTAVERAGGKKALAKFEEANSFNVKISKEREALQKILGTNKHDEAIFDTIHKMAGTTSRGDQQKLFLARKAVGADTWDEIAAGVLDTMGRDAHGEFSFDRYLTARSKLSATGKAMLFNTTGKKGLAKTLDDIDMVAKRFSDLQKNMGNPSGTARNAGWAGMGYALATKPFKLVGSVLGGRVVASYLASPAKAKVLADYLKAYDMAARMPGAGANKLLGERAQKLGMMAAADMGNPQGGAELVRQLFLKEQTKADQTQNDQLGAPQGTPEGNDPNQRFNDAYNQGRAF